jgi:hypothetical protein
VHTNCGRHPSIRRQKRAAIQGERLVCCSLKTFPLTSVGPLLRIISSRLGTSPVKIICHIKADPPQLPARDGPTRSMRGSYG